MYYHYCIIKLTNIKTMFKNKLTVGRLVLVMALCLAGTVTGGGIALASPSSYQQTDECTGSVKDPSGNPIIGAAVQIKGTLKGVSTDMDGKFSLSDVNDGDILVFQCIGYKTVEAAWTGGAMDIVMEEDTQALDEVVVVGYGVQKKVNVSGSVYSVKMDDILGDRPQPSVSAALQGAVPGLYISTSSNTPGQTGKSIQIRGTATFSGSNNSTSGISPLILIDNVPGDIDALNPDDIESVTVLKDASSSAIYGARAAAGVVLITTKRPQKAEKVSINSRNNFGFINPTNLPKQVDATTYLGIYQEAFNTDSYVAAGQSIPDWLNYLDLYKNDRSALGSLGTLYDNGIFVPNGDNTRYYLSERDIYERMMETGFSQTHNISVSGATDRIRFRVSGNGYFENGPLALDKDKYKRMSFSGSVSADVTKWFTQEVNFLYTRQDRRYLNDETGYLYSNRLMNFLPDGQDPDGIDIRTPRNIIENSNTRHTNIDTPRFMFRSVVKPVKGLEAVFEYTYQKQTTNFNYYSGKWTSVDIQQTTATTPAGNDYYVARNFYDARNSFNLYATYKIDVAEDHHFSLMAGYSQEDYDYAYYNTNAEEQALVDIPSMGNAQGIITTTDDYAQYAIRSGFFRFNYDYKEKYILEVSGRYDGSSKFPKASRFAFFPSFSVAWNVANEGFAKNLGWLNELKPRFSYGSIGNQNTAGYYDYISTMALNTQATVWLDGGNDGYVTSIGMPGLVSANFTWETITTTNAAVDFAFFNNRLTGTFEWYQRDTKDILSESVDLPSVIGAEAPNQNVGALRTRGWELSLQWRGKIGSKVDYNVGVNLWDYKSTITSLNFNTTKNLDYLYEGKTVGEIWGYEYDGFYTVDDFVESTVGGDWVLKDGVPSLSGYSPRPGDYKFKNLVDNQYGDNDVNNINSGQNTADEPGDRKVIGNTTPRYQYGINLGISYAGFSLNVMLQGVGKRDYMYTGPYLYTFNNGDAQWYPVYEGTLDYWTPVSTDPSSPDYMVAANPGATLPRIYGNLGNAGSNRRNNDHMLSSAAYMRIKNLTLSYTFPQRWLSKIQVSNLRLFLSMENLATFSSLPKGLDPETLAWSYPMYRTMSFGLNLSF